ncbi:MAG: YlxR family protein [Chlorobia bacterium]|nr:YlxR family protein [Fimbriimonadaceae bacterium]
MPTRTCIGCRRKDDQGSFLRVSRESGGRVAICERGGLGRSAYFCRESACIEAGLVKEKLARALKTTVTEAQKAELKEELVCKLR